MKECTADARTIGPENSPCRCEQAARNSENGAALLLPLIGSVIVLAVAALLLRKADDRLAVASTARSFNHAILESFAAATDSLFRAPVAAPETFTLQTVTARRTEGAAEAEVRFLIAPHRSAARSLPEWRLLAAELPLITCSGSKPYSAQSPTGEVHARRVCGAPSSTVASSGLLEGDLAAAAPLRFEGGASGTVVLVRGAVALRGTVTIAGAVEIHAAGSILLHTVVPDTTRGGTLRLISRTGPVGVEIEPSGHELCVDTGTPAAAGSLKLLLEGAAIRIGRKSVPAGRYGCPVPPPSAPGYPRSGGAAAYATIVGTWAGPPLTH